MSGPSFVHCPVLLEEAVNALKLQNAGVYVDCTFGRGGHSRFILSQLGSSGRLIAFDKDPDAITVGQRLAGEDKRLTIIHSSFAELGKHLDSLGTEYVNGILIDLGVSSPQLEDRNRGFSFRYDGPLDMRMDTTRGMTVAQWLASAAKDDIKEVIKTYGEERFARQIATAIVAQRSNTPITTTRQLAVLIGQNVRTREAGQNPATRTFQAFRIFINRELEELTVLLPQAARRLAPGGRLVVISFHSLEDRIVKHFLREASTPKTLPIWVAVRACDIAEPPLTRVGKPIRASHGEVKSNPRSRSAVMRVAERTTAPWQAGAV